MSNKTLNLSWGDPVVVREALFHSLPDDFKLNSRDLVIDYGYTPHLGNSELIERLKDLAKRQSGHRPKHLFITCGANGGLNAAIYAMKTERTEWVVTNPTYYPLYPQIVKISGLKMIDWHTYTDTHNSIALKPSHRKWISLIDSPSAPEGGLCTGFYADIWDSAYASKTYGKGPSAPKGYKIIVGSLSKVLGLAGLRLGWVSTDDDTLAERLSDYVEADYAGLSSASMDVANQVLSVLDLDKFEELSSQFLNQNRKEMQKVFDKFKLGKVPERGMFAIADLEKNPRFKKALEKSNIKWQPGNTWGKTDSWGRFSLGQSRKVIKEAVKRLLK